MELTHISLFSQQPIHKTPNAETFFETYLTAPFIFVLYLFWKVYTRGGKGFYIKTHEMDLTTGMRTLDLEPMAEPKKTLFNLPKRVINGLF